MDLKYLGKLSDDVSRCVRCGGCQATCPTYNWSGDESMVARGRMALLEAVIDGRLEITKGLAERIDSCLDCRACTVACPSGVKVDEIIYAAKAEITARLGCNPMQKMVSKGMLTKGQNSPSLLRLLGAFKRIIYDTLPNFLPLPAKLKLKGKKRLLPEWGGIPLRRRKLKLIPEGETKGRVAFYVGCAANMWHQSTGESVIEVLRKNGREVILVDDEVCCAIPFLSRGDRETAEELALKNIDAFTSLDVEAIVTCCATCGSTLKEYPRWIEDERAKVLAEKVMDINYYIIHYLDFREGLGKLDKSVTWHDPCHLSRGQGIKDEPRDILSAIPGLNFIEMNKPCHCCGFGGEVSFNNYEMSMAIAGDKVNSITASGADEVATGCPACKLHLEDAMNHFGERKAVLHPVDYLAEAYRVEKERL